MSSQYHAARFRALYEHRVNFGRRRLALDVVRPLEKRKAEDVLCARAVLWDAIGRFPQTAERLHRVMLDEYGTMPVRRVFRNLALFLERGWITHTEEGYARAKHMRGVASPWV